MRVHAPTNKALAAAAPVLWLACAGVPLTLHSFATALSPAPIAQPTDPAPASNPASPPPAESPAASPADIQSSGVQPTDTTPATPRPPDETAAPAAKPPAEPRFDSSLETVLTLKDGGQVVGQLVEVTDDMYVMRISGIDTRFPRESVRSVQAQATVEERYQQMRAAVADTDIDQRLILADWLRARKKFEMALQELKELSELAPGDPKVRDLRTLVEQQLIVEAESAKRRRERESRGPQGPSTEPADALTPPEPKPKRPQFPLLTQEQVNLIRVYELDLKNLPPVNVPRELVSALIKDYASDQLIPQTEEGRADLYRRKPGQIIDLMFRLRARPLYGLVKVNDDPPALQAFRDDVYRGWIVNMCATNRCHGGEDAGRLWLASAKPHSDQTVYTNFLIIDRFRLKPGPKDAAAKASASESDPQETVGLIDYAQPSQSPLLQLGLPRQISTRPHPVVRSEVGRDQWRPAFRSTDDRRFRQALEWIGQMYQPRPDYSIEYEPPVPGPLKTVPADAPAAPTR